MQKHVDDVPKGDGIRFIISAISAASTLITVVSVGVIGVLFHDMNTLYTEIMVDMSDFQACLALRVIV